MPPYFGIEGPRHTLLPTSSSSATSSAFDKCLLRKRSIIETINDQLKNIFNLEHSRHRSLFNYVSDVVACLVAYSYQEKKPALNLRDADFRTLFQYS